MAMMFFFLWTAYLHGSQHSETLILTEPQDSAEKGMSINYIGKMWQRRIWDAINMHSMK